MVKSKKAQAFPSEFTDFIEAVRQNPTLLLPPAPSEAEDYKGIKMVKAALEAVNKMIVSEEKKLLKEGVISEPFSSLNTVGAEHFSPEKVGG